MFRSSHPLLCALLATLGSFGCHGPSGADPLATGEELVHADPVPARVLHLVASSAESLFHTRRHANGAWDAFGNVEAQAGQIGDIFGVEARYAPGKLFVADPNFDDQPWLTNRSDDGRWAAFTRLRKSDGTDLDSVASMALGRTADGNMHVCANRINITSTHFHGIWSLADDRFSGFNPVIPQTGDPGGGRGDCAGVGLELIFAVVGVDPGLRFPIKMAVRRADGSWSPFVTTHVLDASRGRPIEIDLEPAGDALHLVVTTNTTQLHAMRTGAGWTGLADVETQAGNPGGPERPNGSSVVGGAAAVVDGELHVAQVTLDSRLMHTIRSVDGSWRVYRNVLDVVAPPPADANFSGFVRVAMTGDDD